jgi:hypothetical protein
MSDKNVKVDFTNPPVFTILGIIFITLKLMGHINWSWWYVLMPFWIPIAFGLLVIILMGVVALCNRNDKR